MATLREDAEFHRLALAIGLIGVDMVVAWADQVIALSPEPPIQLIDVSLAGSRYPDEVIALLGLIPGEGDLEVAAHRVLGLFLQRFRSGDMALRTAVDMLEAYQRWAVIPDQERFEAVHFWFDLPLIQQGYYGT